MQTRPTVPLTTTAGAPLLCEAQVRASQSMPSRLKVTFTVPTADGISALTPDGLKPFPAESTASDDAALCPEFRLEMN